MVARLRLCDTAPMLDDPRPLTASASTASRRCLCSVRRRGSASLAPLIGWVALLGVACGPDGLAVEVPWLELEADVLTIERADPELETLGTFGVRNVGTGVANARIEADGPFEVVTPRLRIGADERALAALRFIPDGSYEPQHGTLRVFAGHESREAEIVVTIDDDVDGDDHLALAAGGDDCDDRNPRMNPSFVEVCDGLDNDCNGVIDDVDQPPAWFPDADGDGYGDAHAEPVTQCARPAVGWVTNAGDCDDTRSEVYPGAPSRPDGLDNNCDGTPT